MSRLTIWVLILSLSGATTPVLAQSNLDQSVARQWMDLLLESIRADYARPVVHARNLCHVSAAMWNGWAVWEDGPTPWLFSAAFIETDDTIAARDEAISFAAYRLLLHRFALSPGFDDLEPQYTQKMLDLGYDPANMSTSGNSPAEVGNRIAVEIIIYGITDGANEAGGYINLSYEPVNEPLVPPLPGAQELLFPNRWQPLAFEFFVDQAGNVIVGGYPEFLGPEWGGVSAFALSYDDCVFNQRENFDYLVYHDPGPPPMLGTTSEDMYLEGFEQVLIWSEHLDATNPEVWDISPSSIGNAEIPSDPAEYPAFYDVFNGGDPGTGYDVNPVTGEPYEEQLVPRGDYTRVLAEFWADGPDSETPPGHWFVLLNYVNDHPLHVRKIGGEGPVLDQLEWDVKAYLAMGGTMHDAAIASWGVKGWYDYLRPISAIRWMAENGQRSDAMLVNYHEHGLRLLPGLIEVVTEASIAQGERHEHLAGKKNINLGKIAARAWRGPDFIEDPDTDVAGVDWILVENWWPYQRPTFVTPPFAGYVSGHSTYSRAGAIIMTSLTGSPYFPGGLGEFPAVANEFLVFEEGPSVDVVLQWATYFDASDQCSLSRIWGGIHPPADDLPGRVMGEALAPDVWAKAVALFGPSSPCPADLNSDGLVNGGDLGILLIDWLCTEECVADIDGDGAVNGADLGLLLSAWNGC